MPLRAGRLDRRITIERSAPADDGYNTVQVFAALATVWASYTPARGSERFQNLGREAEVPVLFGIRWQNWQSQIGPGDRVRYGERVFDITAVTEIGRREGLEIYAVAGDDAASG